MGIRHRRRFVVPDDLVVVEVALLNAAILEGDLAIFGERQPHHGRAFDLRANALGIDIEAAVDRGIDPRHCEIALLVDRVQIKAAKQMLAQTASLQASREQTKLLTEKT